MKFPRLKKCSQEGNIILVSLMVSGIAGITLAGYLMMTQQQNTSIYRSQVWNGSMVVTEAGVEDGLELINLYAGSFEPTDLFKWTNNAAGAHWDQSGTTFHTSRTLPDGNSYEAWIYNTNNMPTVRAVGSIPWTYIYASAGGQLPIFAQVNGGTVVGGGSTNLIRNVQVQTHFDPLFVVAMAAVGQINLHGNNIATDSFDSSLAAYSNNGMYPSGMPSRIRANGDIATDAGLVDSLSLANANIMGSVRSGPGTNTIYIGPNGSVGNQAWVSAGTHGIQSGYSSTDFNVVFPPVRLPAGSSLWLPVPNSGNLTTNGQNFNQVILTGGGYQISTLNSPLVINAPSNAIVNILVTSGVDLNGSDSITITPSGAQVRMYIQGSSFSMSGSASINNLSGYAQNFILYGLPTCTSINFGGNAAFTGAIYAPNADFQLGGGGNNAQDFVGSSVTRTVTMNGHFNFHYDENLSKVGPGRGYIPVAWKEM